MPDEIVGFTGTRKGMTPEQIQVVRKALWAVNPRWVVHGGCEGADLQFHDICWENNISSEVWPAVGRPLPQHVIDTALEVMDAKSPLERNHDIVDSCDLLLATPKGYKEELRSGTWATIRYARKEGRKYIIIWPNGDVINHA